VALEQFRSTTSTAVGVSDITIAGEHFLLTSIPLATPPLSVRLVVFKSLDAASSFIRIINRVLVSLGFVAVLVGCLLVFAISNKFTKPLDELVAGVQAIHNQEFDSPLDSSGKDEFVTLTRAFDHMRSGLTQAQEQLLDAVRLATIGRMASSISHDLRHRLTAVVANAEFLADEDLSRQRRLEFYNEVATAVRGMTDLLDSLVELSRSPQSLQLQVVSVHTVVRKALEAIRSHPRFRHVEIDVQCNEDIHGWFDPKRLERVFYNLILNACEILLKSSGRIKIGVSQSGDKVEIRVTDNGPGVPECIRQTLFQPFVSSGKQNGSGLGLAIVQKCCHDHGGKAVLESSSPGHTTFHIVLPIDCVKSPHAEIANPSRTRVQGALYEV
jgi:signal transduction histidine kinase